MTFGDEIDWSTSDLEEWLNASEAGFTSGLGWNWGTEVPSSGLSKQELLSNVTKGLDSLYTNFSAKYKAPLKGTDVALLPPWSNVMQVLDSGNFACGAEHYVRMLISTPFCKCSHATISLEV